LFPAYVADRTSAKGCQARSRLIDTVPCANDGRILGTAATMAKCNICARDRLELVPAFARLARVTSDCKPFPNGGALAVCGACGAVQKPATPAFLSDIAKIYGAYDVYYQGGGAEQMSFDAGHGVLKRRSDLIVERLAYEGWLKDKGVVLDFGCGNGAMLAAIARKAPGWILEGTELDERWKKELSAIHGFEHLYVAGGEAVPNSRYDLITMIHALEHLTDPMSVLCELTLKLKPGGVLFIQSPNLAANPFDLLIADHATHFTPASMRRLLARAGFGVRALNTNWVSKELSVIASAAAEPLQVHEADDAGVDRAIAWVDGVSERASRQAAKGPIAVFGTSIAATWLTAELGSENISMYVDEDPARQGRDHFGRPIVAPAGVAREVTVFVCLAPGLAETVAERLSAQGLHAEL
jgi:SAM-dependent methyltransferase